MTIFRKVLFRSLRPIFSGLDYISYALKINGYRRLAPHLDESSRVGGLLFVSGRGFNRMWAQIWTVLSVAVRDNSLEPYYLSVGSDKTAGRYFRLMGISPIYLDSFVPTEADIPRELALKLKVASKDTIQTLEFDGIPLGQMATSTYFRNIGRGEILLDDTGTLSEVRKVAVDIWASSRAALAIFEKFEIRAAFFTEVFMEEYGGFYYAALESSMPIVRFAGTVRDDAFILQHLDRSTERLHHGSLHQSTLKHLESFGDLATVQRQLNQNFHDRYGDRWARSRRNQPQTALLDRESARAKLQIPTGRKVAVVFSHILYDTIFFYGRDLFDDYATWFLETIRIAIRNDKLDWYIKIHPSNVWRSEGRRISDHDYEETYLIERHIGPLPTHVKIVTPDTGLSPLTWIDLADFGITVRGTAGLEMAARGGTVITAGSGRYEGVGFTIDSKSASEYTELLSNLPNIEPISGKATELATRYAHALFVLKPFTLSSLVPRFRLGVKEARQSDDLIYIPRKISESTIPADLERLSTFLLDLEEIDLVTREE